MDTPRPDTAIFGASPYVLARRVQAADGRMGGKSVISATRLRAQHQSMRATSTLIRRILTGLNLGLTLGLALAAAFASPAAAKPLVVILAEPDGTVATDILAPYAILAESGAVEVKVAAPTRQPVRLTPGHAWLSPQATLADLQSKRPDVVIVPAMADEDDPVRAAWLRAQLKRGVHLMSICNGARVLAKAGVLDGRQATVHWFSQGRMSRQHPKVAWRRDVRWVTDGPVTTTAGISAGEPATLDLLRRLAGEETMRATARRLSLPLPDPRHNGEDYRLTPARMAVTVANRMAIWGHEAVEIPLQPGFDELALGTALDGWSRTFRSSAWATGAPVTRSRRGLMVHRSRSLPSRFDRVVALPGPDVMARTFAAIGRAYGQPTARFVALQFEHPLGLGGPPKARLAR